MSTTYRFRDSSVPAQSTSPYAVQAVYPHTPYLSFSVAQQQLAATYTSFKTDSSTIPQSPTTITHAPATDTRRKRLAHRDEYIGSNLHPRKKRKKDNSTNLDTREHVFTAIPATDHEMSDAVEVAKQQEPLTPHKSPPDHTGAVVLAGQHARSASPSSKSANLPAVSPITPPSTPPAQPGNNHDQSREVKKARPGAEVPITSPPESLFVAAPIACNQALHPAYSGSYEPLLCPRCRSIFALAELRAVQVAIEDKGGVRHWCKTNTKVKDWKAYLHGGDEHHMNYALKDRANRDISLRHCKKRLMELKLRLEGYAEQEAAWEEVEVRRYRNLSPDQVDRFVFFEFLEHSARYALQEIDRLESQGDLTLIQDHNSIVKHESALNLRRSLLLEDNEQASNDGPLATPVNSPQMLPVSRTNVYNTNIDSPAKRMHRDHLRKVSFDSEVKIYVENDVDVYRKNTTTCVDTRQDLPAIACAGPNADDSPSRPFETIALQSEDSVGRDKKQFAHRNRQYTPGSWAHSPGSIIVDTSGKHCRTYDGWEGYNRYLQTETDHWDARDVQDAADASSHAQSLPVDQQDLVLGGEDGFSFSGFFRDSLSWLSTQMPHAQSPTTPGVAYMPRGYFH
jgi:hypothetical protein